MRVIVLIAANVFKESVRDRVPYVLVIFAVLLMATSYLISQLTAGQDVKVIKDLGLAAMSVIGLLIAVFIGIGLVSKEIERRSIYSVVSKPVGRRQFVVGKYLGLTGTLVVNVAIMTAAYYLVLGYMSWIESEAFKQTWPAPAADPALLKAIVLILGELALVTAIALFFSTFSSPLLSALFTAGFYVAGQFITDLASIGTVVKSPAIAAIGRALSFVLPNFEAFDVKSAVVHALPVPVSYVLLTLAYGAVYVTALLVASAAVFSRRDFK